MIRDLRTGAPAGAPPQSDSLAFAREHVLGVTGTSSAENSVGAFTIAVTAPRMPTCKRGLAAHLAMYLARVKADLGLSVCVLDTDIESRDVGLRFDVTKPALLDVANDRTLRDDPDRLRSAITRIDAHGLGVVPVQIPTGPLLPLLQNKAVSLLDQLRAAYDFVVLDAPVGCGVGGEEWEEALLQRVDALVVAVSAESSAFGGALRYLNALGAARSSRALPETFDAHLVLTGSEEDGSRSLLTQRALDRNLRGVPIVASIPQLWGRRVPGMRGAVDLPPRIDQEFAAIVGAVTGIEVRSPRA